MVYTQSTHVVILNSKSYTVGCLCIGLTDSVLSSGPIVLTVPQKLIPGRSRRKSSSATVSNLRQLSAVILGMNPTRAELSACARAQVAVRYEVNGRGRYRLLSHNIVLLNTQPAEGSLPRECFNLQLATQNRKSIITHVTCAEAGRGESGPARQHAHVLPSVHCSRERERWQRGCRHSLSPP